MKKLKWKKALYIIIALIITTTWLAITASPTENALSSDTPTNTDDVIDEETSLSETVPDFTETQLDEQPVGTVFSDDDSEATDIIPMAPVAAMAAAAAVVPSPVIPFTTHTIGAIGGSYTWEVPIQSVKPQMDIVYVIDMTQSMGAARDILVNTIPAFNTELIEAGAADINWGVAWYKDYDVDNPWYNYVLPLGNHSLATVQSRLQSLVAQGGGDIPEDSVWGYMRAVAETPWRADSQRVVILITDATTKVRPSFSVGGYPVTNAGAAGLTSAYGIQPCLLTYGSSPMLTSFAAELGVTERLWLNNTGLLAALRASVISPNPQPIIYEAKVVSCRYLSDGAPSSDVTLTIEPAQLTLTSGTRNAFLLTATGSSSPVRYGNTTEVEIAYFANGDRIGASTQIIRYTVDPMVVFIDWDNSTLKMQLVEYGSAATAPAAPTRTGYRFTGWDTDFSRVTGNLTVTALYAINIFEVTFVDWNGTVIDKQSVAYLGSATAPAAPTRTGYTFTGWDVAFSSITRDLTVTALYAINNYEVTFVDWNGTVIDKQTVPYLGSATAPANPSRTGYTFTGWDVAFSSITRDLTVTALYAINGYEVTFVDWDGAVINRQTVPYLGSATAPANPTRTGYTFTGWDVAFSSITRDLTVTALYAINNYEVTFVDWNSSVINKQTVPYLGSATAPANPSRTGYTFTRWDVAFSSITRDLTVTALYAINNYEVTFVDWNSSVINRQTVPYLGSATAPANPSRTGYTFTRWDVAFSSITRDLTVTALYAINNYEVTFVDWDVTVINKQSVPYLGSAIAPAAPTRTGYTFTGWDVAYSSITGNLTVTAQYSLNDHTVTYKANDGTSADIVADVVVDVKYDQQYTIDTIEDINFLRSGYSFNGWNTDANGEGTAYEAGAQITISGNVDLYAQWTLIVVDRIRPVIIKDEEPPRIFIKDHVAYIIGYPEGDVRPANNVTRAEVVTVFFRLLENEVRERYWSQANAFTDVSVGNWYNNAVSVMSSMNIIIGYNDGTFRPNGAITRAELTAIAARFAKIMGVEGDNDKTFNDISKHWAVEDIVFAASLGWVEGYGDGSFRPNQLVTRAELMMLVNRMLERVPETPDDLLNGEMVTWVDNADTTAWYYLAVQEATNSHLSVFKEKNVPGLGFEYEYWVEMSKSPDWAHLEKT